MILHPTFPGDCCAATTRGPASHEDNGVTEQRQAIVKVAAAFLYSNITYF